MVNEIERITIRKRPVQPFTALSCKCDEREREEREAVPLCSGLEAGRTVCARAAGCGTEIRETGTYSYGAAECLRRSDREKSCD